MSVKGTFKTFIGSPTLVTLYLFKALKDLSCHLPWTNRRHLFHASHSNRSHSQYGIPPKDTTQRAGMLRYNEPKYHN